MHTDGTVLSEEKIIVSDQLGASDLYDRSYFGTSIAPLPALNTSSNTFIAVGAPYDKTVDYGDGV
jgi:hypothetical protein